MIDETIDELCAEAIGLYFDERSASGARVEATSGGLNNRSFYVRLADASSSSSDEPPRYVLRICNNGKNERAVDYEMSILEHVSGECERRQLSFAVPRPVRSRRGATFETLSSGAAATLTALIPGRLPSVTAASSQCALALQLIEDFGSAAGQLSAVLADVDADRDLNGRRSPNPALFDPWRAHHAITRELFFATLGAPSFDAYRPHIDYLLARLDDTEARLAAYLADGALAQQLIHGDLHHDNVLVDADAGRVTGILDFEFCAVDWRAQELAICISKWLDLPEPLPLIDRFARGYFARVVFADQEIRAVPFLIVLRLLTNIIFFVGRVLAKEEALETLTRRFPQYHKRILWIVDNTEALLDILSRHNSK